MTEVKNVLVFPAGTEIAFEIYDALKDSKFVKLFGGTSVPCHAEFVFENCIEGFPFADAPGFTDFMNRVIEEYKIDYIYPAHDSALKRLSDDRELLHAEVVASPKETVNICRSKNKTYTFLSGESYIPRTWENPDEIPAYPVFIKPAVGQGSEGARVIADRVHLDEALAAGTEYAVCEYLPGKEVTVDCFTDACGRLRVVRPRTRERIRAGIAVRSRSLPDSPEITAVAESLNSRLVFTGAWFFQLKQNTAGEYRLLEAAPRIAGTMGLTRSRGINMPMLTLFTMWGYDVDILDNGNNVLLDRAFISRFKTDLEYDTVYVDFDDTLVVRDKVNAYLMMFLYEAANRGKRICLLTRHSTDIYEDLARFRIPESLFDEIVRLYSAQQKADFVRSGSIFIDDSFAERKRIREKCGIPVFDLDMVESLL